MTMSSTPPGRGRPNRPPTHRAADFAKLAKFAAELEDIAEDGAIEAYEIDEHAADNGAPREQLYAALTVTDEVVLKTEHLLQFHVCVGGCQEWGSLSILEHLLDTRDDRLDEDKLGFDVVPRACLDRCAGAPAIVVRSQHGEATIAPATTDAIDAALPELLGV